MALGIILIVIALVIFGEIAFCLMNSKGASDFTYYFCRPFGIEMSEILGILVRILLVVFATWAVIKGISLI